MSWTKMDQLKSSYQNMTLSPWKASLRNTAFANQHMHLVAIYIYSTAWDQIPPSARSSYGVGIISPSRKKTKLKRKRTDRWQQSSWGLSSATLTKRRMLSVAWWKSSTPVGREEGRDKWPMSYKSASKQHFNCMWRRAEATAVNNLCATKTLAQARGSAWHTYRCVCAYVFGELQW